MNRKVNKKDEQKGDRMRVVNLKYGLLIFLLVLACGCSSVSTVYKNFDRSEITYIFIEKFEVTSTALTESDQDVIKRSVVAYVENLGMMVRPESEGTSYVLVLELDIRSIGYNIFLMSDMYSFSFEINVYSPDGDLLYKKLTSSRLFFSPQDYKSLQKKIKKVVKATVNVIKDIK